MKESTSFLSSAESSMTRNGQPDFLEGGAEMGALIRQKDWTETPLGTIAGWPQSLRSAASICLGSAFPIAIYWGPELALVYNDAWSPIPGIKHPWALGRPAQEVWPEIWETIGPLFAQVLASGEATRSKDQLLPMRRHGYTEECYFDYTFSPIRGESGKVEGIFNAVLETTERVIGERRSRTLRELAARLAEARTAEAVCAMAAETLANDARDTPFCLIYLLSKDGTGARLAAASGIDPDSPVRPESWPIARIAQTGETVLLQDLKQRFDAVPCGPWPESPTSALVLPVTRSGRDRPYAVLVAGISPRRIVDADYRSFFDFVASRIAQALANAEIIEQERQRAEALAAIDRAKTMFFSNVSHEFRTPLTLMLGHLENLLAKKDDLAPEDREQIATAHRNSLRLLKLVNSLLDFSRIEAGRMKASYAPVDLAALTADLASNFRSAMEAGGLRLIVECSPLPQPVYVDRDMWEKIVLNLLSNAFKFTFSGSVTVKLEACDGAAALTVSDTGVGIPEAEIPHIFERFHRVEGARGRTYEGTGIGLALIQELLKLHGGTVEVKSREGEGSAFTVKVPFGSKHLPQDRIGTSGSRQVTEPKGDSTAVRAEAFTGEAVSWLAQERLANPSENFSEAARPREAGRRPLILVADDNADMREHVSHILGSDYEVIAAADGAAALAIARQRKPDLILSDVMMPGLDGFALLAELRGDAGLREVPVILLSARAGEEARMEGIVAGADDYLTKPFSARELSARVKTTLDLQRVRREAREQVEAISARLQTALAAARMSAWEWDLKSGQIVHSENTPDVTGQPVFHAEEAGWAATHPEDEPALRKIIGEAISRREGWHEQVRFIRPDTGAFRWMEVVGDVSSDETGVPVKATGVMFDVTERKRAEQLDEEHRRMLELIASGRPLAECLTALTEGVARLSPGLRACVLIPNEERSAMAATFTAHFPPSFGEGLRGARINELPIGTCGTAIRTGKSVTCADIAASGKWSQAWKDLCLAHKIRAGHSTPVFGDSGRPIASFFLCFAEPREPSAWELRIAEFSAHTAGIVIERDRSAAALRESEKRFRELAEVGPQFIWISRVDGSLEYVNQRWTAYSGLDLAASSDSERIAQTFHDEDREELLRRWENSLATGEPFEIEARLRRADGAFRWFVIRSVPLHDEAGRIVKWFGASTDIHEQKTVQEDLRAANADLEQFAYSASHDLQEPMRTIKIYSELLETRYREKLDGHAVEFLDHVHRSAGRLQAMLRDLLTYTQSGRLEHTAGLMDAGEAVKGAMANLAGAIEESRACVTVDPMPSVAAHATGLQQIFQNLIGNAIKYCRPGQAPVVHIGARRRNGSWLFSVTDNGIGVDAEYKERIFGLFKRLHTADQYSGSGIGLALCKRIVERYHGRIWVESEPGKGSSFYFTLPS